MARKKVEKKYIDIKIIIFLTLITTAILTWFSLSEYTSTFGNKDTGNAAQPILNLYSNDVVTTTAPIAPKSEQEFYFEVSGENESNSSEVTMEYKIELSNLGILPLKFRLYKFANDNYNTEIPLTNNVTNTITKEVGSDNQKYMLKIVWNDQAENYNSYKYKKLLDYVQIVINSQQKD